MFENKTNFSINKKTIEEIGLYKFLNLSEYYLVIKNSSIFYNLKEKHLVWFTSISKSIDDYYSINISKQRKIFEENNFNKITFASFERNNEFNRSELLNSKIILLSLDREEFEKAILIKGTNKYISNQHQFQIAKWDLLNYEKTKKK